MIKKIVLFIMVICIGLAGAACQSVPSNTAEDNAKNADTPTKRVVAGTVSAMGYLDALGVDIVGRPTTDKEIPEKYKDIQEIGMPMTPNLELVLACDPDIFIADSNLKTTLDEMFFGMDIEVILLDNNSYSSVETNITLLAEKLDKEDKAKEVSKVIQEKKEEALKITEGKEQPSVAVVFGTTAMFMLGTEKSYTGDIVKLLGVKNITDSLEGDEAYVTFDREKLAELNPDVILRLSHADPEETAKAFDAEFQQPFWQGIKAVQEGRVYDLDTTHFGVTANYNSIDAPKILAEMLYGE